MSLLIKNGKIWSNGTLINKNIFVKDGKIAKITSNELRADESIDAKGKITIPGLIDGHVHFREPGMTHKEDFFSGSMAAAAGGITTFLDMPNTIPATTNLQLLDDKRRLARKSIVNYGFHFGSTNDNISEIEKAKKVASVKVYMDVTTGNLKINELDSLKKVFSSNKTVAVHVEGKNAARAIDMIQEGENDLYVCHAGVREIEILIKEKIRNKVYVEVSPHHLFLNKEDLEKLKSFGEMKPRLGTKKDQNMLWEFIKKGKVDTIATDHAPHTKEEKLKLDYPFGVPGCETMLPLLLNACNDDKITLKKIIELCCENPAKIFKIRNKGFIKEGYDGDLTLVDLDIEKEIEDEKLFTKCKWSPFNGWKLKGWPVYTIVNGNIVNNYGKINNIKANEVMYNE